MQKQNKNTDELIKKAKQPRNLRLTAFLSIKTDSNRHNQHEKEKKLTTSHHNFLNCKQNQNPRIRKSIMDQSKTKVWERLTEEGQDSKEEQKPRIATKSLVDGGVKNGNKRNESCQDDLGR